MFPLLLQEGLVNTENLMVVPRPGRKDGRRKGCDCQFIMSLPGLPTVQALSSLQHKPRALSQPSEPSQVSTTWPSSCVFDHTAGAFLSQPH